MSFHPSRPNSIRCALYYPFPYVQNENWLKEQALFWDHLYRIVPVGFREMNFRGERIDPTVTERGLRDELGFIQDCQVDEYAHLYQTAERLNSLVIKSRWLSDQVFSSDDREYFTWGSLDGVKDFYAVANFFTPSGAWRYVPGMVYMALLAKIISAAYGLPIVTDDSEHDSILKLDDLADGRRIRAGGVNPWNTGPSREVALLYSVVLSRIGCENLENVSVRDIIAFRQNHDEERRDFVDEIQRLAEGLKARQFVGEDELRQYLAECAEKIDRRRLHLIAAMRANSIDAVLRSSAISAPLIAAAAFGGLPQIGAAVGGTLGTAAILYGSRRARWTDMVKDSAVAYAFLIGKEFSAHDYMSRFTRLRVRRSRGANR